MYEHVCGLTERVGRKVLHGRRDEDVKRTADSAGGKRNPAPAKRCVCVCSCLEGEREERGRERERERERERVRICECAERR